jgi:hypothetical protein
MVNDELAESKPSAGSAKTKKNLSRSRQALTSGGNLFSTFYGINGLP